MKETLSKNKGNIDISFSDNKQNYIYNLLLSLKNYKDFLESNEEKNPNPNSFYCY